MTKLSFVLLSTIFFTLSVRAEKGEWELEKDESGIKIYTRTIEGESVREFKAITTIKASRAEVAKVITNVEDYANWYPDIASSEVIKKISTNEYYVYNVLDLPWPATDRDNVTKMAISVGKSRTTIKMHAASDVKEKDSKYVRITKSYGFWLLEDKGDETKVHFQYFANPGGDIPDWMINMFLVDNPFTTLKLLKEKTE